MATAVAQTQLVCVEQLGLRQKPLIQFMLVGQSLLVTHAELHLATGVGVGVALGVGVAVGVGVGLGLGVGLGVGEGVGLGVGVGVGVGDGVAHKQLTVSIHAGLRQNPAA